MDLDSKKGASVERNDLNYMVMKAALLQKFVLLAAPMLIDTIARKSSLKRENKF